MKVWVVTNLYDWDDWAIVGVYLDEDQAHAHAAKIEAAMDEFNELRKTIQGECQDWWAGYHELLARLADKWRPELDVLSAEHLDGHGVKVEAHEVIET